MNSTLTSHSTLTPSTASGRADDDDVDLGHYLDILVANKWLVAAITALVLAALLTVTSGVWCIYAVANRLIAVFILLAPVMCVAATGVSAVSIASSDRAERARARLKAQGLELGF